MVGPQAQQGRRRPPRIPVLVLRRRALAELPEPPRLPRAAGPSATGMSRLPGFAQPRTATALLAARQSPLDAARHAAASPARCPLRAGGPRSSGGRHTARAVQRALHRAREPGLRRTGSAATYWRRRFRSLPYQLPRSALPDGSSPFCLRRPMYRPGQVVSRRRMGAAPRSRFRRLARRSRQPGAPPDVRRRGTRTGQGRR